MEKLLSIAIVEDKRELRENLKQIFDLLGETRCLFEVADGAEVLTAIATYGVPDVILMDMEMPVQDGIKTTAIVKAKYPNVKILMLTVFDQSENVFNALKNGADGYLLKGEKPKALLAAVRQVYEGRMPMSPEVALKTLAYFRNLSDKNRSSTSDYQLTRREIEVLELLCDGLSYKQIGDRCHIAERTVSTHIENIYKKLNVHSAVEASKIASKNEWF